MANQEPSTRKLTIAQEKDVMGVTERRDFPVHPACKPQTRLLLPGRETRSNSRIFPTKRNRRTAAWLKEQAGSRANWKRHMRGEPLPELLRDLGAEAFLDDPVMLRQMAAVALERAREAAGACDAEHCELELELYNWCARRLAGLAPEDAELHRASLRLLN
jgi:hypothetical protein